MTRQMTQITSTLLACVLGLSVGSAAAAEWENLFDGKTLDGWVRLNGKAAYNVEDETIVGRSVLNTPNSFLCTERHFSDFILELDFMVDARMNSGVQIRSNSFPEHENGRVHGYQVEIDPNMERGRLWTGGIYDEARRGWLFDLKGRDEARKAFKPNAWNRFRIEAIGNSIKTWVNGVPAADLEDDMTAAGFIALQVHQTSIAGMEVHWRNIRIQDLAQGDTRPDNALVLLGKNTGFDQWTHADDKDKPIGWRFEDGVATIVPKTGSIATKDVFDDFRMHVEFCVNDTPNSKKGQDKGNSGVYIQRRYEVQILDSLGVAEPTHQDSGAIYKFKPADVNACFPPGQWQSYDIDFQTPRWDSNGKKTRNARISLVHNGRRVHDNVEVPNKTGMGRSEGPEPGPILLQEHGNAVKFRNIWIVKGAPGK